MRETLWEDIKQNDFGCYGNVFSLYVRFFSVGIKTAKIIKKFYDFEKCLWWGKFLDWFFPWLYGRITNVTTYYVGKTTLSLDTRKIQFFHCVRRCIRLCNVGSLFFYICKRAKDLRSWAKMKALQSSTELIQHEINKFCWNWKPIFNLTSLWSTFAHVTG